MYPAKKTTTKFNTKKSIEKTTAKDRQKWTLSIGKRTYSWTNDMERIEIVRRGLPYDAIEEIGKKIDRPVKMVLTAISIPQTTYNKKKKEQSLLEKKESELVLLISELVDYGIEVFNKEEEKFQRWLKKPNQSLSGNIPESMLDTVSGINEIKYALNRIEFGNLA
ncbi:type II RES/Xre toxin-antitoxin system antitoxin [Niabella hirudinis]|uniref:type II RES/Xre toxin-antitoxin system antitoxin n=1 Tax=Niabella hirudinis TaxID=1285929 RepID=UPI003EBA8BDA